MFVNNGTIQFLQTISIFEKTPKSELEKIALQLDEVDYSTNEIVFNKGDIGDSLYIIQDGRIHIHDGNRVISNLGSGEIFGELSLLEKEPRKVTATVLENSRLLQIKDTLFYQLMEGRSEIAQGIIQILTKHKNSLDSDLTNLRELMEKVILPLGIALSTENNIDRLLERILTEAKNLCNADAGTIYFRTEDDCLKFFVMFTDSLGISMGGTTDNPIPYAPICLYDDVDNEPNYDNVASYVALTGHSINIPDIYHNDNFDFSGAKAFDLVTGYRSIANLTVPLKNHNNEVIGVLQLFNPKDQGTGEVIPFTNYQQLVVESLTSQAAVALNTQQLLRRQQVLLKFEHDLVVGRGIQSDFLPDVIPEPEGWELAALFQPAREVAGDFFDAFEISGDKIGFVVADVADKGVGAALFMALSRSLIRAFSWLNANPEPHSSSETNTSEGYNQLLTSNHHVSHLSPIELTNNYITEFHLNMNMFVTLFYGVLDSKTGTLTYINAGHNPPVIVDHQGEVKHRIQPTAPAVGIFPDMEFKSEKVILENGDLFLGFTDGVIDARDPEGCFFTEDRLISLLGQGASTAHKIVAQIESELKGHVADADPYDDITLIAISKVP